MDDEAAFQAFEQYNFNNDSTFQKGLKQLPNRDDKQVVEQAKLFYYSKTISPIDSGKYREWKSNKSLSFAEVVGMLSRGEEIPGIKDVPDKISEEMPSISITNKAPPKPWEQQLSKDENE